MLDWTDAHCFTFDGEQFCTDWDRSTREQLIVVKERSLLNLWAEFFPRFKGARIVELGIYQGGSTALLALLTSPHRLLAADLAPHPVDALSDFLADRGLSDRVTTRFALDQRDADALAGAARDVMGDAPLDLVIDDASHDYSATVASFEVLFPRLRPGGLYIVEDWCWAERASTPESEDPEQLFSDLPAIVAMMQERLRRVHAGTPLHRMALELVLARASTNPVLGEVTLNPWWLMVERGEGRISEPFRYDDLLRDHFDQLSTRRPARR